MSTTKKIKDLELKQNLTHVNMEKNVLIKIKNMQKNTLILANMVIPVIIKMMNIL